MKGSLTRKFLKFCDLVGSQGKVLDAVEIGRVVKPSSGLPAHNYWPEWNTKEMRSVVKFLKGHFRPEGLFLDVKERERLKVWLDRAGKNGREIMERENIWIN